MMGKRRKVVVAEDELFIRMDLVLHLEDEGLEVLAAGSADEALRLLQESGPFDMLITDVNMPGELDGVKLAQRVTEMYPHMKVIVTSGNPIYADVLPSHSLFVSKPYDAFNLAEHSAALITDRMPRRCSIASRPSERHAG